MNILFRFLTSTVFLLNFSVLNSLSAWYRGNTHCHTVLCGHADTNPDQVAKWYLDNGYDFLCLSEHNLYIDPKMINLKVPAGKQFLLIPGEEISHTGGIHTTALNTTGIIDWKSSRPSPTGILEDHISRIVQNGGMAGINHPTDKNVLTYKDIIPLQDVSFLEIFNAHPSVNTFGGEGLPGAEEIWDSLLSRGKRIHGIAVDDAHNFQTWPGKSNPGKGWIMVNAERLNSTSILMAIKAGNFYASNGVWLNDFKLPNDSYGSGDSFAISIDTLKTLSALTYPFALGKTLTSGEVGFFIELIGEGGKVLARNRGSQSVFTGFLEERYLRIRAIYAREGVAGIEEFYAWSQPLFLEDRQILIRWNQSPGPENQAFFQKFQIAPNPASERVKILFSLSRPGEVTLKMFNLRGQKVAGLPPRNFSSGSHFLNWRFKDQTVTNLASGAYWVRVESGPLYLHKEISLVQ